MNENIIKPEDSNFAYSYVFRFKIFNYHDHLNRSFDPFF